MYLTDKNKKIINKYKIDIYENMELDTALDEIDYAILYYGFDADDKLNDAGYEIKDLYDDVCRNNNVEKD